MNKTLKLWARAHPQSIMLISLALELRVLSLDFALFHSEPQLQPVLNLRSLKVVSRTDLKTSEQQKLAGVMRSCFEAATPNHRRREVSRIFSKWKEALFLNRKEKQRRCEGVNLKGQGGSESDGSLRLPLSSCRTN